MLIWFKLVEKADTGIAVEGASDAARSAADIVFLAPGLSAIIDALKVGHIFLVWVYYLDLHDYVVERTGMEHNFPNPLAMVVQNS
jgi:hypothetical protein